MVLEEQAKLAPNDPQPLIALGMTCRQAKRNDEARQAFEKAAATRRRTICCLVDQLVELDVAGQAFRRCVAAYAAAVPKNARCSHAHIFWKARILAAARKLGSQRRQSSKSRSSSIPILPPPTICWLAAYLASNKAPQAVSQLEALLAKDPKQSATLMTLALVYDRMKDYPKARDVV